jgi:hypothetical protein
VPSPAAAAPSLASALRRARRDAAAPAHAQLAAYAAAAFLQRALAAAGAELARPQAATPALHAPLPAGRPLREAAALRPGVLLVDHPAVVGPGRAVELCFDISQQAAPGADGAAGAAADAAAAKAAESPPPWLVRSFVLNRPFPASVAAVTRRTDLGAFGALPLFSGGPHGGGALSVLHALEGIPGAVAIDGEEAAAAGAGALFVGGDLAAINAALAAAPSAAGARVKALLGCSERRLAADDAGGLSLPDEDAVWLADGPAAADVALLGPQFDATGLFRDGHGLGASDRVAGYNHARFFAQNAVWSAAVRALADDAAAGGRAQWAAALRAAADLHPAATHAVAALLPVEIHTPRALSAEARVE